MNTPVPFSNATDILEKEGYGDYLKYDQDGTFTWDSGLMALPLAGATPAVCIVRLHGGFGTRTLDFDMIRKGRPPIVPTMNNTINDTLLSGTLLTELPKGAQTGSGYTWAVGGTYTFVQLQPRIVGQDTFPMGTYPGNLSPQDNYAYALGGAAVVPPYTAQSQSAWNAQWNALAAQQVDISSGSWTWPFLAFPPVFSTDLALAN